MGNARELMARLGPTTVKFDIGRGGKPDLTNQDIAAALGMVPAGLGRELLEALWWPESGSRRRDKLRREIIALVQPVYLDQLTVLSRARTEYGIAKACMGWGGASVTDIQRKELKRTEVKLEEARALCWPNNTMEQLGVLAGAVFNEIAHAGECKHCSGSKVRPDEFGPGVVVCEHCHGSGYEPLSGRKRAAAIGADWSAYSRFWQPVYLWMLERMREAEVEAVRALGKAVSCAV